MTATQPNNTVPFNPNDFIVGNIRTGAQVFAGWIVTWLLSTPFAELGIMLRENNFAELFFTLLFTLMWRQGVDLLAKKYPVAGWLNGFPTQPNYIQLPAEAIQEVDPNHGV